MSLPLTVLAPVAGTVLAMAGVPDPVFAGEIVGPGLAIDPSRDGVVTAIAPVAGKILKLHPHAYVIVADGVRGVLVHLGLDTVQLGGVGFTLHVAEVEAGGRSPICPVVALGATTESITALVTPGAIVRAGEPLFQWA